MTVLPVLLYSLGLHHLEDGTGKVPTPNYFSQGTGYDQKIGTNTDAHQNPTQFSRFGRHRQHFQRHIRLDHSPQHIFRSFESPHFYRYSH
jgi:hypothetical protein